mgnify:CR=1 FL=1
MRTHLASKTGENLSERGFSLFFFLMYAAPEEDMHTAGLILLGIYFLSLGTIVIGVNLKMKSR